MRTGETFKRMQTVLSFEDTFGMLPYLWPQDCIPNQNLFPVFLLTRTGDERQQGPYQELDSSCLTEWSKRCMKEGCKTNKKDVMTMME